MNKPGPKREWDSNLESIIRRWPYIPEHMQRALSELVSHYGPAPVAIGFPTPPNANWSDLEIVLISPKEAKFKIGQVEQCYTFSTLGLADKRNAMRPRTEWRMLRTYAENPEPDAYYKLPQRSSLKVDISKFRRWLQSFFGIPGDPLKPFATSRWLPVFKIRADY